MSNIAKPSLLDLNPDFVLEVLQTLDPQSKTPSSEAKADLKRLLDALDSKNFYIEIRPGSIETLLVFVKLNDADLASAFEESKLNDWYYGIDAQLPGQNGIDLASISNADKLRIVYQILTSPTEVGGCGITPTVESWNFVRSVVPVSNSEALKLKFAQLKLEVTAFNKELNERNIQFLLEQFGSKYAFYHEFLNTYNNWLLQLGCVGVLSNFILQRYSIVYTYVNLAWAVGFYFYWKTSQLQLAKKWNVSKNIQALEPPKSGTLNLQEPTFKRLLRELSFIPTALVFVGWLVACQFFCFAVEIFLNEVYDGWLKPYLSLVPTVLLSAMVPVVTLVYNQFVSKQLQWENHAKFSTFNYSRVIKTFVFNFLTSYMALFITSFLYLPFGFKLNGYLPTVESRLNSYVAISVKRENFAVNKLRLNSQYQYFILTNQIVALVLEFVLPTVLAKVLLHPKVKALMGSKPELEPTFQDAELELAFLAEVRAVVLRPEYDIDDEYRQLVLQFGFLVMFGPVWSLGPFISLVVNLIQQKLDFVKLFLLVKTPVPSRADSIFPWDNFLKLLLYLGSASSVAIAIMYHEDIISSSSRSAVGIRWWKVIGPALVTEHVVILVVQLGDWILGYYADYLDKQQAGVESDLEIRKKYIDTVYQRKTTKSSSKSLNDVSSLLSVASLAPATLLAAKAIPGAVAEKTTTDKELLNIDSKIAKVASEKQSLDKEYTETNNAIKSTESNHISKVNELATAASALDSDSKGLIDEKAHILNQLELKTGLQVSELEQLKLKKAYLEQLKTAKTAELSSGSASAGVGATLASAAALASTEISSLKNSASQYLNSSSLQAGVEKLKEYVPESVSTAATAAVGSAAAVAAVAQSKLVDLQNGSSKTESTPNASTANGSSSETAQNFDLQKGDRIITSKANINGELKEVVSTIDGNDHFNPAELEGNGNVVPEITGAGAPKASTLTPPPASAKTTPVKKLSTASLLSLKSTPKKSKSPLKSFIKKINL